jgi:Fe-S-cluster-containing hydrogenase component 2
VVSEICPGCWKCEVVPPQDLVRHARERVKRDEAERIRRETELKTKKERASKEEK